MRLVLDPSVTPLRALCSLLLPVPCVGCVRVLPVPVTPPAGESLLVT
jgi:hypothetical protein